MGPNPCSRGLSLAVGLFVPMVAAAIECTSPPSTALRDYKAEFDVAVVQVLALRGPSAKVAVQSQAKNLLDKIPNADKALVELTYLFTLCTALRDDKTMPEREKARQISDYTKAVREAGKVAVTPSSRPVGRVAAASSPPAAIASPGTTVIKDNTGPVVQGNSVGGHLNVTTTGK